MGRGGKWIRGMEKNTAIPQRRHGEIPDEKTIFHWRKWSRRKKAIKGVMKRKQNICYFVSILLSPPPQSPKAEPILYCAF